MPARHPMLWLIPPALSLLVLAAHFYRGNALPVAVLLVLAIGLLAVRRWWAARLVQLVLMLGVIEWVMTLAHIAFWRLAAGEPVVRLALILGAVAAFTAWSAALFQIEPLRSRYGLGRARRAPDASA